MKKKIVESLEKSLLINYDFAKKLISNIFRKRKIHKAN